MKVKNLSGTPRTFQAIIDKKLYITDIQLDKMYSIRRLIEQPDALETQNIENIFEKISCLGNEATAVIINDIIDNMEIGIVHFINIYKLFLKIQRRKYPESWRILFSYPYDAQIRYCIRKKKFNAMREILSMLKDAEIPNLFMISLEIGDMDLFQKSLFYMKPDSMTDILPYLPNMNQDEDKIFNIAQDLINKNIGIFHSMRAASNALEQKKYKLFSLFMKLPTMDVTKWDNFLFREAIYYHEIPCATLCLLHPTMVPEIAEELLTKYKNYKICTDRNNSDAIRLLKSYLKSELIYPETLNS